MVCILGIGDCESTNKKTTELFNEVVTNNVRNTLINIASSNTGVISGVQKVKISGIVCHGNANFGKISQSNISKINFANLSEVMTEDKLTSMLENAVKQAAESDQEIKKGFMSGATTNSDATIIKNKNIQNVVSNYTLNDFRNNITQVSAMQEAEIINNVFLGDCNFPDGISQTIELDVVAKNIGSALTKAYSQIVTDNSVDQKSKSKQSGDSDGPLDFLGNLFNSYVFLIIAIIAAILLAVFVGPAVARRLFTATT